MPIRPKPTVTPQPSPPPNEAAIQAFISKGGSVALSDETGSDSVQPVNLKIPKQVLNTIDELVAARPVKTYRVQWLLEAIHEKIQRERKG